MRRPNSTWAGIQVDAGPPPTTVAEGVTGDTTPEGAGTRAAAAALHCTALHCTTLHCTVHPRHNSLSCCCTRHTCCPRCVVVVVMVHTPPLREEATCGWTARPGAAHGTLWRRRRSARGVPQPQRQQWWPSAFHGPSWAPTPWLRPPTLYRCSATHVTMSEGAQMSLNHA